MAETTYERNTLEPEPSKFSVYDENLNKIWPSGNNKQTWDNLYNVYAFATTTYDNKYYLYGIDYDHAKIFRVENTIADGVENYAYNENPSYVFDDGDPNVPEKFGVDLDIVGNCVYGLFIRGDDVLAGEYTTSAIAKVPLSLDKTTEVINTHLAPNAFGLKRAGDYFFVPSIGGAQHSNNYNPGSKIQRVALTFTSEENEIKDVLKNADSGTPAYNNPDTADFRDLSIAPDGTVFILKGIFDSFGAFFSGWLFRTTVAQLNTLADTGSSLISLLALPQTPNPGNIGSIYDVYGFTWALLPVPGDDNKVWLAKGDYLAVYEYNGTGIVLIAETAINDDTFGPAGWDLNSYAVIGDIAQLRGAHHHHRATNRAKANAAKAKHAVKAASLRAASKASGAGEDER